MERNERQTRDTEIIVPHPWYHNLFENWKKTVNYRDGLLGRDLTPDVDEIHFDCAWPKCKFHKVVRKVYR